MSSYQFVNSLASCYAAQTPQGRGGGPDQQAQQQAQQQLAQQQQQHASAADYYNPNAAGAVYPPACYSPPQVAAACHYPPHPYATPAPASQGPLPPTEMVDYTQLQPPEPPHASCKYADSASPATAVASPQDLTTARGSPPQPQQNKQPASTVPSPPGKSTHPTTAPPNMASPASSTSSASSGDAAPGSASKSGKNGANPPQIYPWMKRVHLGQSEYSIYFLKCM